MGPTGLTTARGLYEAALKLLPSSGALWEAAIDFEAACSSDDRVQRVLSLYERATAPAHSVSASASAMSGGDATAGAAQGSSVANGPAALPNGTAAAEVKSDGSTTAAKMVVGLSEAEREQLSLACLAWADVTGDGSAVATAAAMHCKRFPLPVKTVEQGRKRAAAGAAADGPAAKKPASVAVPPASAAPASSTAPATPPASAAYPAGYYPGYGAAGYSYPPSAAGGYYGGYYGQSYQYPSNYTYPAGYTGYSYPAPT
jgi:hypothetical protein